jgi:hypothetical protein
MSLHSLENKQHPTYKNLEENPELYHAIISYLKINNLNLDNKNQAANNNKILLNYTFTLGNVLVHWLINIGLFDTFVNSRKVPYIKLKAKISTDLLAVASYYKPLITTKNIDTLYSTTRGDHVKIILNIATSKVQSLKKVSLTTTHLSELADEYTNMPMSLDKDQIKDFLQLLQQAITLKVDDPFYYHLFGNDLRYQFQITNRE